MDYKILIVDDELEMCLSLAEILNKQGYQTQYTTDPHKTNRILTNNNINLIIMDIKMPQITGIDLLKIIKKNDPSIPVIMISGYPSIENAVKAMKYGAINFFIKPLKLPELFKELKQLSNSHANTLNRTRNGENNNIKILTRDPAMKQVLESLEIAAKTDAPIIITGESGTGKELCANMLHYHSPRAFKPFVKVNCAALPETILESELFGHEKGAFTDASQMRIGKFELADKGTILLDEIGDMSLKTQAKILRVLQEQEFERVGGMELIHTNIRVIACTNKEIDELIKAGKFREDLYYRLSVIIINLPPLRERKEDILLLADHFIKYFNKIYNKKIIGINQKAKNILLQHSWPGNIREFKNCIERAVIFCKGNVICYKDFPSQYKNIPLQNTIGNDYTQDVNDFNRKLIIKAMTRSKGVKQKAAKLLNIDRKTLYNRIKKLGIE